MSEGRSVPILNIEEGNNNISINTDNVDSILDQVGDRQFVLISINGPTRTGKSFMLTKFLSYIHAKESGTEKSESWMDNYSDKSFEWRGKTVRVTKGINMWSKPVITTLNGKEIAILLMDTQGNFDNTTSLDQNAKIFAISSLFSSVLIFNAMRDIREDMLQFFQLFSGFAKMINEDKSNNATENNNSGTAQKLIFLLRDMEFPDYKCGYYDDENCPIGQIENLKKEKLNAKVGQPLEVKKVREDISSTFEEVGLFCLPYPGKDFARKDMQDNLEPEFKFHMKEFVPFMFEEKNLKLKHFGGIRVTGREFKKYVHCLAGIFSGNSIPRINTVYETAAEMQSSIAVEKGINAYEQKMQKLLLSDGNAVGCTDEKFEKFHKHALNKAIALFRQERCLGGVSYEEQYLTVLEEEILSKKSAYLSNNLLKREREAERLRQEAEIKRLADEKRALEEKERVKREEEAARKAAEAELQRKINEARKAQEEHQRQQQILREMHENEIRNMHNRIAQANNSPPDDCHIL